MIAHLLADQTAPFAVAIGLMLLIALVEGVGALFGFAVSGLVDSLLPDLDVPDVDVDLDLDADVDIGLHAPDLDAPGVAPGAGPGLLTQLLTWICFGRVPALVLLVAFLTAFGISGLVLQSLTHGVFGAYLPAWIAVLPALAVAVPSTRYLGLGLARIVPKEETEAVSRDSFIGKVVVVIRGEARRGLPAEAKFRDQHGQTHYVLVEPDRDDDVLPAGTEVLLVSQVGGAFRAIENTNAALSRQ